MDSIITPLAVIWVGSPFAASGRPGRDYEMPRFVLIFAML
jgi:hypothetical protein